MPMVSNVCLPKVACPQCPAPVACQWSPAHAGQPVVACTQWPGRVSLPVVACPGWPASDGLPGMACPRWLACGCAVPLCLPPSPWAPSHLSFRFSVTSSLYVAFAYPLGHTKGLWSDLGVPEGIRRNQWGLMAEGPKRERAGPAMCGILGQQALVVLLSSLFLCHCSCCVRISLGHTKAVEGFQRM